MKDLKSKFYAEVDRNRPFEMPLVDAVTVGDLNSDAPGSGARKSAGKDQMDLVPVSVWRKAWDATLSMSDSPEAYRLGNALKALEQWQEGSDLALTNYLGIVCLTDMDEAVKVLEFGAKKYKAWNWAKGMPWSVPTGCILRHSRKIVNGELVDDESGHSHLGHIICNIIMLERYITTYPEGDDRPPRNGK